MINGKKWKYKEAADKGAKNGERQSLIKKRAQAESVRKIPDKRIIWKKENKAYKNWSSRKSKQEESIKKTVKG